VSEGFGHRGRRKRASRSLQENVTVSASGLLSELRVFDVYRGPGIETGRKKSVALGLILQDFFPHSY